MFVPKMMDLCNSGSALMLFSQNNSCSGQMGNFGPKNHGSA